MGILCHTLYHHLIYYNNIILLIVVCLLSNGLSIFLKDIYIIDFDQSNIDDFHYSLILDIANNKLSRLALPPTEVSHLCHDVGAKHHGKMHIIEDISTTAPDDILHVRQN